MKERDPQKLGWLVSTLCKYFPYKEIGWQDIDEVFFRWTIVDTHWFKIVLHRLDAEYWHSECHDHPWDFLAIVLWDGYWELLDNTQGIRNRGQHCGDNVYWRGPGSLLYRRAESKHNVITPRRRPNWSIVIMGTKRRPWGFLPCTKD
jgi:hypothetical protein